MVTENLFVFELANNHNGDLSHGLRIIDELGTIAKQEGISAAVKFQFRELSSFIHPQFQSDTSNRLVRRFLDTRLEPAEFAELAARVRYWGMSTMATPFDEISVKLVSKLGIERVKVASCMAQEWKLLEEIRKLNLPTYASCAGLSLPEIDRLVSFFEGSVPSFTLLHCVGLYPTPPEKAQLGKIRTLKQRYKKIGIGLSTHEPPHDFSSVQMAYSFGARVFEKHIGIATELVPLNAYSASPGEVAKWIRAAKAAVELEGTELFVENTQEELDSLRSLKRGVFAKRNLKSGEVITKDDIYFAFPLLSERQARSQDWSEGAKVDRDIQKDEALDARFFRQPNIITKETILVEAERLLREARVAVSKNLKWEISHHHGLESFSEFGAVIINCIDRNYCKKLIILMPGQTHPAHLHHKKEETFTLLWGDLTLTVDEQVFQMSPGDSRLITSGSSHALYSQTGAVIEEISTRAIIGDSIYQNPAINNSSLEHRKSIVIV